MRVSQYLVAFLMLLSCVQVVCASADSIQLRPAETTVLVFNEQIQDVRLQSGINAEVQVENFPHRGLIIATTFETFSSGNFHVIFENGDVRTFNATADTTAPLHQEFKSSKQMSGVPTSSTTSAASAEFPVTSLASAPPDAVKPILSFLQNLEQYPVTRLHFPGVLPYGVVGMITRVQEAADRYVYEVEVENILSRAIQITVSDFEHGLTEAIYIVSMSPDGNITLPPSSRVYVYISERL